MHDHEEQFGFALGHEERAGSDQPRLNEILEDVEAILQEARRATADGPWDSRALRFKKIVFLQLVKLLPDSEGEQPRFEFLDEIDRIERLLAA